MAIKKQLDSLEGLSKDLAALYVKTEDGKFKLDIDGDEDVSALKNAKNHERELRKQAESKLKEAQAQLDQLNEEREGILKGAIPKGDVEKLESSYKSKLAKREAELGDQVKQLSGVLSSMSLDSVASSIASIAISPAVIMPHVKSRLAVEFENGKPTVRVLDKEGKPSALTPEDLKKEFLANKDFSPILQASKGSGSGASNKSDSGASGTKFDMNTATPAQLAAHIKERGLVQPN